MQNASATAKQIYCRKVEANDRCKSLDIKWKLLNKKPNFAVINVSKAIHQRLESVENCVSEMFRLICNWPSSIANKLMEIVNLDTWLRNKSAGTSRYQLTHKSSSNSEEKETFRSELTALTAFWLQQTDRHFCRFILILKNWNSDW